MFTHARIVSLGVDFFFKYQDSIRDFAQNKSTTDQRLCKKCNHFSQGSHMTCEIGDWCILKPKKYVTEEDWKHITKEDYKGG